MVQRLSKETLGKIRNEIQNGKSKYRTAAEFGLHPTVVYRWTQDLPGGQYGWPGIRGKTLEDFIEHMKTALWYVKNERSQQIKNEIEL